jgi:hypothetical protein
LTALIKQLENRGHWVQQCSPYHLKIGPVNYFWTTGRITTDPDLKHPGKGFEALLALLDKRTAKKKQGTPGTINIELD